MKWVAVMAAVVVVVVVVVVVAVETHVGSEVAPEAVVVKRRKRTYGSSSCRLRLRLTDCQPKQA